LDGRAASRAHRAIDAVRPAHFIDGRARLLNSKTSTTGC